MVDFKDIQLFSGLLLVNECPRTNSASSLLERNIPLRLQNISKYPVDKMVQHRGGEELSKRGNSLSPITFVITN